MVQTGAWLAPRVVIEEAGYWREYISPDDDGEFYTRVLLASSGVRYCKKGCVYYRKHEHETRVSSLRSREALRGWILSIDSKRDHLLPRTTIENRKQAANNLARQYWSIALDAYPQFPKLARSAEDRATQLGFPNPLHAISKNGWKSQVSQSVRFLLGWRAARWLQSKYHRAREQFT
jgi:GT2 family glycosyltransferase